jgi:hypothetical protein
VQATHELLDDELGGVDELRRVERFLHRHALTPAVDRVPVVGTGGDVHEQDVAAALGAEAGAERRDQIELDASQLERREPHQAGTSTT